MSIRSQFVAWSDRHPVIGHAVVTLPIGLVGASVAALLGAELGWRLLNGLAWAALWIGSQEWTDERVHRMLFRRSFEASKWWHGWDWRDFAGGLLGGVAGVVLLELTWRLL